MFSRQFFSLVNLLTVFSYKKLYWLLIIHYTNCRGFFSADGVVMFPPPINQPIVCWHCQTTKCNALRKTYVSLYAVNAFISGEHLTLWTREFKPERERLLGCWQLDVHLIWRQYMFYYTGTTRRCLKLVWVFFRCRQQNNFRYRKQNYGTEWMRDKTILKFDNYGYLLFRKDIMILLYWARPKWKIPNK